MADNPYRENIREFSTQWLQVTHIPDEKGKRVLELGCNTGYIGSQFSYTKFSGVEFDREAAAEAERTYECVSSVDLNKVDLKSYDPGFKIGSFDILLAGDVLEHLLYPEEVLGFFLRYLKDGGLVIISLPNVANIRIRMSLLLGRFDYADTGILDKTHLYLYTKKSAVARYSRLIQIEKVLYGSTTFGRLLRRIGSLGTLLGNTIVLIGVKRSG